MLYRGANETKDDVFKMTLKSRVCITCRNVKRVTFEEFGALYVLLTNVLQRPLEKFEVIMFEFLLCLHGSFNMRLGF